MAYYQFVRGTEAMVNTIQMLSIETFSETFGDQNQAVDLALFLKKAYATEKLLRELEDSDTFFYLLYAGEEAAGYLKLNVDSAHPIYMIRRHLRLNAFILSVHIKAWDLGVC